eukprot:Sspe_Gene.33939::Locus_16516_Transcript_1_1_Confidence_1.000_Length_641::g.33939::m.33939
MAVALSPLLGSGGTARTARTMTCATPATLRGRGVCYPTTTRPTPSPPSLRTTAFEVTAAVGAGFKAMSKTAPPEPRKAVKPKANDPCSCNSGKKYKKCCGDPTKQSS